MTETRTTVRPPATIGQAVGIAETELTRLLAGVLAETGTPRETYLALQRLSFLGGAPATETFVLDLSDALALDEHSAAALQDRLRRSAGRLGAELVAPFDASDIETTIRTLQAVTERARQMRSADQNGEPR